MSENFVMNKEDMKKLGKGLLIALLGALLTFLEENIINIQFGSWTPVIVALNSVIVNLGRKWIFVQV